MRPDLKHDFSGIYGIRCIPDNKIYIGKAKSIFKRIREHVYRLNSKQDPDENPYLQNAWKKYCSHNFEYLVIERVDADEVKLAQRELFWMNHFESLNRDKGFNLRSDSDSKCIVHQDTRNKISARLIKEWSEGVRSNHSSKLKESWKLRDHDEQSQRFSKTLTKYQYLVDNIPCSYKKLQELKLQNCIATFWKNKQDIINFKGHVIKKVLIEDIVQSS